MATPIAKFSGSGVVWLAAALSLMVGCGKGSSEPNLRIVIDGSSTVLPISQAVAEEFGASHPEIDISVAESGTGGGFDKFGRGEIDIADASRPIKESEAKVCKDHGIEYVELKIAIDGLSVVVHPKNTFVTCLSVGQLKAIWENGSTIRRWKDVDPTWPDKEIELFGADTKSGTYDYFKEAIVGKDGKLRDDYSPSTDDNTLVVGVAGNEFALGFFGYAYYEKNKERLRAVAVAPEPTGKGPTDCAKAVEPTRATIEDGSYTPLSRPLFIYVNKKSLRRPEIREFVDFYVNDGLKLVPVAGYVPLPESEIAQTRSAWAAAAAP